MNIMRSITSLLLIFFLPVFAFCEDVSDREAWEADPHFSRYTIRTIAVLPMDNFSLEPEGQQVLQEAVYARLKEKGYTRIAADKVTRTMEQLGVKTPGQLAGISLKRLGALLNADAVLTGQVEQSGSIHTVVYDAVVVSCTLRLVHAETGTILWRAEQWRTAHRQWQLDPVNMLINFAVHQQASRKDRIIWLADQMLKTLPNGQVLLAEDNLLQRAVEVPAP